MFFARYTVGLIAVVTMFGVVCAAQEKKPAEKLFELRRLTKKVAGETFLPAVRLACSDGNRLYVINYGNPSEIKRRRNILAHAINFRDGCGYDATRITFVDAVTRKGVARTIIWRVHPDGEDPPA